MSNDEPISTWYLFSLEHGSRQKLPPVKKDVLVKKRSLTEGFPDPVVLGYLKFAAGDKESPQFITPGAVGFGDVYAWCDCIKEGFNYD